MAPAAPPSLDALAAEAAALCDRLAAEAGDAPLVTATRRVLVALELDAPAPYYVVSPAVSAAWAGAVAEGCAPPLLGASTLAALIAAMPSRLAALKVPAAVEAECAKEFRRILRQIAAGSIRHCEISQDLFLKDLALCRLRAFPCVAAIVDMTEAVGRKVLRHARPADWPALARLLLEAGGVLGPVLGIHLHRPLIGGFRPAGWETAYGLCAELLTANPHLKGVMGSGWFYDPALKAVSPELAYLHDDLKARGAIFIPLGSTPEDVTNATAAPGPRRALMAEGKYRPTGYVMVWPRRAVLKWAAGRRAAS